MCLEYLQCVQGAAMQQTKCWFSLKKHNFPVKSGFGEGLTSDFADFLLAICQLCADFQKISKLPPIDFRRKLSDLLDSFFIVKVDVSTIIIKIQAVQNTRFWLPKTVFSFFVSFFPEIVYGPAWRARGIACVQSTAPTAIWARRYRMKRVWTLFFPSTVLRTSCDHFKDAKN